MSEEVVSMLVGYDDPLDQRSLSLDDTSSTEGVLFCLLGNWWEPPLHTFLKEPMGHDCRVLLTILFFSYFQLVIGELLNSSWTILQVPLL